MKPLNDYTKAGIQSFTSADTKEGSGLHTITKAREDAYARGKIDGLFAALTIIEANPLNTNQNIALDTARVLLNAANKLKGE